MASLFHSHWCGGIVSERFPEQKQDGHNYQQAEKTLHLHKGKFLMGEKNTQNM